MSDFQDSFSPSSDDLEPTLGDQEVIGIAARGGNDYFSGHDGGSGYVAFGDAYVIESNGRGGDDSMVGGNGVYSGSGPLVTPPTLTADVSPEVFYSFFGSGGVIYAGDAQAFHDWAQGGNDTLQGGVNSTTVLVGDALDAAYDQSHGGSDSITGGMGWDGYATNFLIGDATAMGASSFLPVAAVPSPGGFQTPTGGADVMFGGDATAESYSAGAFNIVLGDGYQLGDYAGGGADEIHGGSANPPPDVSSALLVITPSFYEAYEMNFIAGDGYAMGGSSHGGADEIVGGSATTYGGDAYAINLIAGDGLLMADAALAGNDHLVGGNAFDANLDDSIGAVALNFMAGDTFEVDAMLRMGNDTLEGGNGSGDGLTTVVNALFGDIGSTSLSGPIVNSATLTDDLATLGGPSPDMGVKAYFGKDLLVGGDFAQNILVGDAAELAPGARGGNDKLVAGGEGSLNVMYGDAIYMDPGARGGNDVLVSGEGNDQMWGDGMPAASLPGLTAGGSGHGHGSAVATGGQDVFVFAPGNGTDMIGDFHVRERDKIDLTAFGHQGDFRSFRAFEASGRIEDVDGGVLLHLGTDSLVRLDAQASYLEPDTVFLAGISAHDLSARSFSF